jgi:hypothetical protein
MAWRTRTLRFALAGALSTTGTCGTNTNDVDVAQLFPDVPQLAALTGVRPGMSVSELRGRRKAAVSAPYIGMMETLNGDTIKYRMVSPPARQSPSEDVLFGVSRLLGTDSIDGIGLWEHVTPMDSAARVWTDRAMRMHSRDPHNVDCFSISRSGTTRVAVAQYNGTWFGVALIEERHERDFRGPITLPAALETFVTSRLELYVPKQFKRQPLSCPN